MINKGTSVFRLLSYPLTEDAPVWPGNPPAARTESFSLIAEGELANTTVLHLFSHSGTHLDAPKHFNDDGPAAVHVPVERFIFFDPLVVEVPKSGGGMIQRQELEPFAAQLGAADLLLLRTGWSELRDTDPQRYVNENPMLHPEGARYLMEDFPNIRGLAIDAPSVGAPNHIPETVETHQILTGLGRTDGRYIIIFEDLRIDPDLGQAQRIYAWPLFIEGSDGSPCTIVAEFM
jgi:kynurenine formamidase